jgi:hypothetical protein
LLSYKKQLKKECTFVEELFRSYGPWLLFGVLMFFMMRHGGGCCGGSHTGHKKEEPGSSKAYDKNLPEKSGLTRLFYLAENSFASGKRVFCRMESKNNL